VEEEENLPPEADPERIYIKSELNPEDKAGSLLVAPVVVATGS